MFKTYFLLILLLSIGNSETLIDDQSGWQDLTGSTTSTSTCGVHTVIGGYDQATTQKMSGLTINKQFTFTQPQTDITIEFDFLAIDKWEFEALFAQINGYIAIKTTSLYRKSTEQQCGQPNYGEQLYEKLSGSVKLPCATTQVVVQFLTRLNGNPSEESFGIKNVKLTGNNRCPQNCDCCQLDRPSLCTKCNTVTPGSCSDAASPLLKTEDLQSFPSTSIWKAYDGSNVATSACGSNSFLGGYQNLPARHFKKTFSLGGNYDTFFISFNIIEIDKWTGYVLKILLNQQAVHSEHIFRGYSVVENDDACGSPTIPDKSYYMSLQWKSPISISSLEVKFAYDCNNAGNAIKGDFGIRDLQIQAYSSCESQCLRCTIYQGNHKCLECRTGSPSCGSTKLTPIITDAYGTNPTNYQGWKKDQGTQDAPRYTCNGDYYVNFLLSTGATYQIEKKFTFNKPYYDFYLSLELLFIDKWDFEDIFIFVNGKLVFQQSYLSPLSVQSDFCGTSEEEMMVEVGENFQFLHSTKSLIITIRTSKTFSPTSHSFGIRNLKIFGLGGCTDSECDQCLHEGSGNQKCIKCTSGASSCVSSAFPFSQLGPTYSGWKGVGNVDLTEYDCSGIKMLGGLQTPYVYEFSKQFQYDVLVGQVSFSFMMYLMGVWSGDRVKITINNEVAFESQHYFSDSASVYFNLCGDVPNNGINPPSRVEKVEQIYSMATPSKTITLTISATKSILTDTSSQPLINTIGIHNIQIVSWNHCGTSCLGNDLAPVCSSDQSCVACSTDLDCSNQANNNMCRVINGVNKCVFCDNNSQCTGNPSGSYCIQGQCQKCQVDQSICHTQSEVCKINTGLCATCTNDPECAAQYSDQVKCRIINGVNKCVECDQNSQCLGNPNGSQCILGQCGLCANDNDCSLQVDNFNKCRNVKGKNQCVQCGQHTDCSGNTNGSYCIIGECKGCSSDTSVCDSSKGEICKTSDNQCGPCTLDSECKSLGLNFDYCLTQTIPSQCVECYTNQHCSDSNLKTPFCIANKCSSCDPNKSTCKTQQQFFNSAKTAASTIATSSIATVALGADPTLIWGMINLMQMFFYLLFMNVKYPQNFQDFLNIFSAGRLEFLPQPLNSIFSEKQIKDLKLESPSNFYENEFSGLFLQSCGGILFACFVSILVYLISKLFLKCLVKGKLRNIPLKIVSDFEWSGFYRLWIVGYFEFMFGTLLQIKVLRFSQFTWAFSSLLSLLILILNLALPIIIYKRIKSMDDPNQYRQKYGVFFEDYDTNRRELKYTLILLLGRRVFQSISIVFFYNFPFLQNFICWATYFIMMIFYFIKRPHNQTRLNFIESLSEVGFFVIHSLISVLTIYFKEESEENKEMRDNIGKAIISMVGMVFTVQLSLILLEQIQVIKEISKKIKLILVKKSFKTVSKITKQQNRIAMQNQTLFKQKKLKTNSQRQRSIHLSTKSQGNKKRRIKRRQHETTKQEAQEKVGSLNQTRKIRQQNP